jgi:hypothetical protein
VKVFNGQTGAVLQSFLAYGGAFRGGVTVATADVIGAGLADIITGTQAGGGPHVKAFDHNSLATLRSFLAYDPTFLGGVFVG